MNGYSDAMQAALNTIRALKEGQAKLRKQALVSVNGYMKKVSIMNQDGMAARSKKTSSSNSSLPL